MKHRLVLMCCTVFSCCLLFAQVPNKKIIPFQHGEDTLYFLSVSIALPDTIYLQLSDSIDGVVTEAKRMQWQTFIENVTKELNCLREKGAPEQEVLKLEERIRKLERNLRWGIAEKMIGRDELVFTVFIKRMLKNLSNDMLAAEKVVFLFNEVKTFYDEYVNAVDEHSIPHSIQHEINLLKQKIAKSNDSIETSTASLRQLKITRRFHLIKSLSGRIKAGNNSVVRSQNSTLVEKRVVIKNSRRKIETINYPSTSEVVMRENKSISTQNISSINNQILDTRLKRSQSIAYREGLAKKIKDYKSYYAVPSLSLTGNALSYLENEEPVTTTGLGIYSRKSDLWEFSAYVTISQTRDLIRAEFNDREVFGNAMLVPGVRKYSLLTSYRNYSLWPFSVSRAKQKLGFGWNVNVTPMNWELSGADTQITETGILTTQVIPFATDLFLSFNWLTSKSPNRSIGKEFRLSTDFGLTFRQLFGDLSHKDLWIEQFLGAKRRFFPGILLGINIAIDNLQIFFNGPILLGDKVEGLSYGQTVANIGLRGKLFNIGNNE